jgi:SagB-type dehydrogenase family enzyme
MSERRKMTTYRKYLKNQTLPGMSEMETDQIKGLPLPPIQKPHPAGGRLVDLVSPVEFTLGRMPLVDAIRGRESRRKYTEEPLSLEELSFLLWATQGVRELIRNGLVTLRTVPCGGGMHPFETYLLVNRVGGVEPGIYRYLAIEHKLYQEAAGEIQRIERIGEICNGQHFVGKGAVVFIWAVRPYRTEWRYGEDSLKDILISAGHICQNLYLACESIGAGTCATVAYQQEPLDDLIGVDGDEEIALYLAPVGKVAKS